MSYDNRSNCWETNAQSNWVPQIVQGTSFYQTQQWSHSNHLVWQSTGFHPNAPMCDDWTQQTVAKHSRNVMQQCLPHYASTNQFPGKIFVPNPQSRIKLVPKAGVSKAVIVKRKRKRTMFTTEQIQSMETFFKRKPYITREERQIFVKNLQISDCSVKVWFQNRRLREKRDKEEREAEALELANSQYEETYYYSQNNPSYDVSTNTLTSNTSALSNYFSMVSFDTNPVTASAMEMEYITSPKAFDTNNLLSATYGNMTDCGVINPKNEDSGIDSDSSHVLSNDCLSSTLSDSDIGQSEGLNNFEPNEKNTTIGDSNVSSSSQNLDDIEAEIEKKTDEYGYVTLDDKAMGDLANVLAKVLPTDVDLGTPSQVDKTAAEDNDSVTYAGNIYEPVSPVVSDINEDVLKAKWEPFAPERSLQKLFDLHFC